MPEQLPSSKIHPLLHNSIFFGGGDRWDSSLEVTCEAVTSAAEVEEQLGTSVPPPLPPPGVSHCSALAPLPRSLSLTNGDGKKLPKLQQRVISSGKPN